MDHDHALMVKAADEWGPGNDPERNWFFRGWIDQRDRDFVPPSGDVLSNAAQWAAYNSGLIAQRGY